MESICSIMLYRSNQLKVTPGGEDMISLRIPISLHSQTSCILVHIPITTYIYSLLLPSQPTTLQEEIIRALRPLLEFKPVLWPEQFLHGIFVLEQIHLKH